MISITCPKCGAPYELENDLIGKRVMCAECEERFIVKDPSKTPTTATQKRPLPVFNSARNSKTNTFTATDSEAFSTPTGFGATAFATDGQKQGATTWIRCPHCWHHFDFKSVNYISRHLDLLGDPILGEDAQKRFVPVKLSANGLAIDEKGMECPEMACPRCHLKIPESIIDLPSSIFSIVGAPSSGKSYFLTTMLWQLRRNLPKYFDLNIGDVDASFNSVINDYERLLFMNNHPESLVALPKTELQGSGYTNQIMMNGFPVDLPKPFIFALTPKPNHPQYEQRKKELERNVILFDNAGEHFQPGHESVNNLATAHLSHSDGIIFLYDPLRDTHMQKFCDVNDPQFQQESSNQLALFYEMASRIRKFSNLQSTEKYHQPLIIAVAKFDVLKDKLGLQAKNDDYLAYDDDTMNYSLNLQAISNMSFLLREKLLNISPEFVAAVESFSDAVYFVPVSAFGCSPEKITHTDDAGTASHALGIVPDKIQPFWAEVPFLLHLSLHGHIEASKAPLQEALPLEKYKMNNGIIAFSFPGVKRRIEVSQMYCGTSLLCEESGLYYTLPAATAESKGTNQKSTASATPTCTASTLETQIDKGFWEKIDLEKK